MRTTTRPLVPIPARRSLLPALLLTTTLFVLPLAAHAQSPQDAPCPNPGAGRGLTNADRAARYQAAAEAAAKAIPPDPCVQAFVSQAIAASAPPGQQGHPTQDSVDLLHTALANAENVWGTESVKLVPFLTGLADEIFRFQPVGQPLVQDRVHEAETLQHRAIAITENAYGAGDAHVAPLLNQLAMIVYSEGSAPSDRLASLNKATEIYEQELGVEEKAYGAESPKLVVALERLSGQYFNARIFACSSPYINPAPTSQEQNACTQQNLEKSDTFLQRAIEISKAAPTANSPSGTAALWRSLEQLAENKILEHKATDAADIYGQMLAIDEKRDPGGASGASDYMSLANAYVNQNDNATARTYLLMALDIYKALPPPPQKIAAYAPLSLYPLQILAQLELREHNMQEAKNYLQQEVDIASESIPNQLVLASRLSSIAALYAQGNFYDDAEALYQRAISIEQAQPPGTMDLMGYPPTYDYASTLFAYANLLLRTQRFPDAKAAYVKALAVEPTIPQTDFNYVSLLSSYFALLKRLGRLDDAQTQLQRLLSLTQDDPRMVTQYANALKADADLLRQMNKPDDATKVDAQAQSAQEKLRQMTPPASVAPQPQPQPQ